MIDLLNNPTLTGFIGNTWFDIVSISSWFLG